MPAPSLQQVLEPVKESVVRQYDAEVVEAHTGPKSTAELELASSELELASVAELELFSDDELELVPGAELELVSDELLTLLELLAPEGLEGSFAGSLSSPLQAKRERVNMRAEMRIVFMGTPILLLLAEFVC